MNSADLVARLKEERDRHVLGYPGPRRDVAELLDNALDRLEALEAWKAEAMGVLRRFGAFAHSEYDDVPNVVGISLTFDNGEELGALPFGDLRAARRLVEKEDGR
ncbi:MAG: hypothetical protein ACTHOP_22160 [Mesorhizobium sp.]